MQDLAPKKAIYMAFAAKKCHHIDNRAWGDIWSDCRIAALSRLYRVSVARRREGRTCLIGRETWILIFFLPFSFPFLCFSSIITTTHDNVMFLRTYRYPDYLLPNFAHTLLLWPPVDTLLTLGPIEALRVSLCLLRNINAEYRILGLKDGLDSL